MIRASAPGKLLLAGEYAVLLPETPALVVGVERRLTVTAHPSDRWSARSGNATWSEGTEPPEALSFVVGAIAAVRRRWDVAPLQIETHDALRSGDRKLGLGGSAAATVAAAFAVAPPDAGRDDLWALCDEVHRGLQGGRGSGVDVATSVYGGLLRYTSSPRCAQPVAYHPDVRLALVWTGESVRTAPRLATWSEFVRAAPSDSADFARRSTDAVALLQDGLSQGRMSDVAAGMSQAREALRWLETRLGLDIETPALRRAAEVAAAAGAAGKVSGAGGGDCAVVVALGDEHRARVIEALRGAGLEAEALEIAQGGVHVERDG